jgi:Family of unknown function (DUF6527)
MRLGRWLRNTIEWLKPPRHLIVVEGDSLPRRMPRRDLVLARDVGEDWCVGLGCPCGCGRTIELLLIEEARPRWSLSLNSEGQPTLHPSVWLQTDCRSHFLLIDGRVIWC